jgi:hypothetical protein
MSMVVNFRPRYRERDPSLYPKNLLDNDGASVEFSEPRVILISLDRCNDYRGKDVLSAMNLKQV